MKKTLLLAVLGLALSAAVCFGYAYNAKTGALSYTFFNLSPNTCVFTNSASGGSNAKAYTTPATTYGWINASGMPCPENNNVSLGANFFNPVGLGGDSSNPNACVNHGYLFYNNYNPIQAPSQTPSSGGYAQGTTFTTVEYSNTLQSVSGNELINPPAMGDSWTITCGNGSPIVMANMASAANMLISNNTTSGNYPYGSAWAANFANSYINPPSPGAYNSTTNPLGAGFVPQTMNLNQTSSTTGGLWLGLNNPNSSNQAQYVVTPAMYPLNLAAYVNSSNVNSGLGQGQYVTPIFGGHFTLAIGDPFIVSSYAAKTLWYMVASPILTLSNNTLDSSITAGSSTSNMSTLINLVVNGGSINDSTVSPVFITTYISSNYLQWLMGSGGNGTTGWGSAGLAADVVNTLNGAASTPITYESFWGKVVNGVVTTATDTFIAGIGLLAGPEASVAATAAVTAAVGAATAADGAFMPSANAAITADFTSTTSLPAPTMATAPPNINSTYSASNLLGMLLANGFAQSAIDSTVTFSSSSTGSAPASGNMLYANYSIYADGLCSANGTSSISVTNNLLTGTCGTTDNSGNQPTTTQSYTNVLSTATSTTSNLKLSIWDAILTGSDITTVQNSSAVNNGYMILQNPSIAAFAPPTQMVNATGTWPLPFTGVNTTFNLSSGLVSLASYVYVESFTGQSTPQIGVPQLYMTVSPPPKAGYGTYFQPPTYGTVNSWYNYNSSSSVMTVAGYSGGTPAPTNTYYNYNCSNGNQTLNMTTCPANAAALLTLTPNPTSTSAWGASCSLSCDNGVEVVLGASGSSTAVASPGPTPTLIAPLGTVNLSGGAVITFAPYSSSLGTKSATSTYNSSTGLLTVQGYKSTYTAPGQSASSVATVYFQNGTQTLDTTTCPSGTNNVAFTFYPTSAQDNPDPSGIGFLSCQALTLPYSLCTSDQQATGGVLAIIQNPPPSPTPGPAYAYELACACIPQYLGGPTIDTTAPNFLQTGGTAASPEGIMLGATSSQPTQACNN